MKLFKIISFLFVLTLFIITRQECQANPPPPPDWWENIEIDYIIKGLSSSVPKEVAKSAYALGVIARRDETKKDRIKKATPELIKLLNEHTTVELNREDYYYGRYKISELAAISLGKIGDKHAVEYLIRFYDDNENKYTIAESLKNITGKSYKSKEEWQKWWEENKNDYINKK